MFPTRRDILKASAGAVALAMVAAPVTTSASEPVSIVSAYMVNLCYGLSDGGCLVVAAGDGRPWRDRPAVGSYWEVTRYTADSTMVDRVEMPAGLTKSFGDLMRCHGHLHLEAVRPEDAQ